MQVALLIILLLSIPLNTISGQSQSGKEDPGSPTVIELHAERSTFLYCTKASTVSGGLKLQGGDMMAWRGNATMGWVIHVPKDEQYELYLIANVRNQGRGKDLTFTANGQPTSFKLQPTSGPYVGGRNFERIKLASAVYIRYKTN